MDQTSAITSQLIRIQSRFAESMWVGVCVDVHVCACDFLLVYVGALLCLHLIQLLLLHVYLCVCTQAFLTSLGYDPYGSYQCDTNLTCLEPAVYVCVNGLLRLSTWQQLETLTLRPATCFSCAGTTKPHFLQTQAAESPPCSWWPLISFLLFIFRLWCDAVYVGGAALWGPQSGPRSCDQALHGVAFGLALWGPVWEQRADLQPAWNARHLKSDLLKKNEGW